MRFILKVALVSFSVWLVACTSAPEKLGSLDLVKWRQDRGACKGDRATLVNAFKAEQKVLVGKFANEVGELLGRPDIHQLGGRNQKFYVYFLEKGTHCDDITKKSYSPKVILRFNAVGLLTEITYQSQPLE
ncbi:hypothetical protein [Telluribacter humicola]|uniref:hypothetical protein n=1 Tax=Telluribacter humicola TaxID=1720261 RepID=UPI001E3B7729|nr:hypothetical protein [Telluribacter humicola]